MVPATATELGGFVLIDHKSCFEKGGISLYTPDGETISLKDLIVFIINELPEERLSELANIWLGSFYTGYGRFTASFTMHDEYIGYDFADVDAEISNVEFIFIEEALGDSYVYKTMVAAIGKFKPEKTGATLNNREEWPEWTRANYTTENYQDITIHNWYSGNETHVKDRFNAPHLDQLGRALPIAITDGRLFAASTVQDIESLIDSSLENIPSLADVPEYALAAQALYELGASIAIIADDVLAYGYTMYIVHDKGQPLNSYLTFGTGYGKDERGYYIALALLHDSPLQAIENAKILNQRVQNAIFPSDYNTLEVFLGGQDIDFIHGNDVIYDTEIFTKGVVLMAKLYTEDPELWYSWLASGCTLLGHID
ncbi:MAG: hypothetical protein JXA17_05115 [Dehalococcoidales bacterium]|nr:hypothetical protein [Dehalococcoidales bacterium]